MVWLCDLGHNCIFATVFSVLVSMFITKNVCHISVSLDFIAHGDKLHVLHHSAFLTCISLTIVGLRLV